MSLKCNNRHVCGPVTDFSVSVYAVYLEREKTESESQILMDYTLIILYKIGFILRQVYLKEGSDSMCWCFLELSGVRKGSVLGLAPVLPLIQDVPGHTDRRQSEQTAI